MIRRLRRALGRSPQEHPHARLRQSLTETDHRIISAIRPYTMTSLPRIAALLDAVRYCVQRDLDGAFAECGVWRGGSILAMILTLQEMGVDNKDIFLYDTFEGMTMPSNNDTSPYERPALDSWKNSIGRGERPWKEFFEESGFNENNVRDLLMQTGYPASRIHFVRGPVEETLPTQAPEQLALLRLDTDWYESTKHELLCLYPRLAHGGVLILDDYGHWHGSKQAVDEYFSQYAEPVLLTRIDYAARLVIKA
nr:class I SAM-dependent methyltransferase [Oceanococcus sp. HetDA_MAG_MS8]